MASEQIEFPRIVISALRGGSGKTILSIGIIAALTHGGKTVAPFKKGPDYIDAGWLALAAGRPCYNLDTFLASKEDVRASFLNHAQSADIAVVEGNRGLFDGIDSGGATSTAELAKLLRAPVILCIDCTKSTRTMAAVVLGCQHFDPEVKIKGVVLNRVAGARHERILRSSIESRCGIPVVGALPKLDRQSFPERHMGLVPTPEHGWARDSIAAAAQIARTHLDLKAIECLAADGCRPLPKHAFSAPPSLRQALDPIPQSIPPMGEALPARPRIGIIRDSAFQFYYPENLDALISEGADLIYISPLRDTRLPALDGLYIGGGFPETHVQELSENRTFRDLLKDLAEDGLPIYAECGGLMYLGRELVMAGRAYPMAGVLPIVFGFSEKPQGHGYTIVSVEVENPFFAVGTELRGHEFHYSHVLQCDGSDRRTVFRMKKGVGVVGKRDGICHKNVLATYTHLHALGTPVWAKAMVRNARAYQRKKTTGRPTP
jgi:cobyrinic acid a,c-diamide synthase